MRNRTGKAAIAAGALVAIVAPNVAVGQPIGGIEAEQVRKLEIMLMVSSLRCRTGQGDFQPEYRAFSTRHAPTLKAASQKLRADLAKRHGEKGAKRALDKISVSMANRYGGGHPWMSCADMKGIAHGLSQTSTRADLVSTARYALAPQPTETVAMAAVQ